tara:strand:- start:1776 stop:2861 length:1086 start_codon:yes stop_codon:yes gene_type:complete
MANGQQEQQSTLPTMSTDMISQTDQLLAEKRAIAEQSQSQLLQQQTQQPVQETMQQPVQQRKPTNLYQALGSMNPEQLLKLKSNVQKRSGRRQIYNNVGSNRGAELLLDVNAGKMTIAEAINRSKQELTPNMKALDAVFFKEGAKSTDMLPFYERMKNTWRAKERNLWLSHFNALKSREAKIDNARIQNNKNIAKDDKARIANDYQNMEYINFAQTDYIVAQTEIQRTVDGLQKIKAMSNEFQTAFNGFMDEVTKDLNGDLTQPRGDQFAMNQYIVQMAKQIPHDELKTKKGFYIEGDFIETFEKGLGQEELRNLWSQGLIKKILAAKNHTNKLKQHTPAPQPEEVPTQSGDIDFSQYMVQ